MVYGYARVSTAEQNEARQVIALNAAGVTEILVDKASGKDFDRPQYKRLRSRLKKGDLLVVQSLDRFGRDYDDIISEWRYLVKTVGCNIKVLDMPLLDTTQGEGLIGRFVSDIVLQILSFVAETERQKIRERQAQGIVAAKARGVKFGRPRMAPPERFEKAKGRYLRGLCSLTSAAESCGLCRTTFRHMVRRPE